MKKVLEKLKNNRKIWKKLKKNEKINIFQKIHISRFYSILEK